VARGADEPIFRPLTIAPSVHGKSGLDGTELGEPGSKVQPVLLLTS